MIAPKAAGVRVSGRRVGAAGSILCFHSVTTPELPSSSSVHVPLRTIEFTIAAARRGGEIIPLRELVDRHRSGRSTSGLVAITFDDAYASLLGATSVLLRRESVPATVFVTTDASRVGARFWWDRLENSCARVPAERWREFETACGLPDDYRLGQPPEFGPVHPFRQWLLSAHRGRWPESLDPHLLQLERDAGVITSHRAMTFEELGALCNGSAVELGVHTQSHPVLPLLPDDELQREIAGSLDILRDRFADALPVLAVPYGLIDGRTARIAREAGMQAALSLRGTTLRHAVADELPRFCMMREEPAWKLHLRLTGFVDLVQGWRGRVPVQYPPLPSATT